MTLILTHINQYGIIHASDSNLTAVNGSHAGTASKTYPVTHLHAGLTVAGAFSVGGAKMDAWMPEFIELHASSGQSTIQDFAHKLKACLVEQMLDEEKDAGTFIHIAGLARNGERFHPEFWFVRNIHGIDQNTGEYSKPTANFLVSEDFWSRDCPKHNLMDAFKTDGYQVYVNGFASGRIGFVVLQQVLDKAFRAIWENPWGWPNWKFRPPRSLQETEAFVRLTVQVICTLFELSDYDAPFIGGEVQTHSIAWLG
jgi:hypothetical protein